MDFRDTPEEDAFRTEVRSFIDSELPDELRQRGAFADMFDLGEARSPAMQRWWDGLSSRGWQAPAWPKEYGGAGLGVMEQFVFNEELAIARAPRLGGIAIGWAGPTLMLYGNDEQKAAHLPRILSGGEVWCQGFSEPGAGSDLAALSTRAVRDGDDFLVNGQKIWTSGAQNAHWMLLLARTDADAPKHKGLSYFVVDMKTPGIAVRPITTMTGTAEFNEVFFEDARVPAKNMLGEENRGWYIATTTLDLERSGISNAITSILHMEDLVTFVRERMDAPECAYRKNPALRYEIADRWIEAQTARLMSYQIVSMQNAGQIPNREASVAKLYVSEMDQRIGRTWLRALGLYGQLRGERAPAGGGVPRRFLLNVASTIGGGTSEIMRNIIAQRGIGLPRE
jgi:alkylation response protein AidB-like acyl-CoA dehydrogenase